MSVLLVRANSWKAETYFSAMARLAAFLPLTPQRDFATISIDCARALPAATTASAAPFAALISSVFWASVNVKRKIEQYILICSFGDTEWQKTKIEIIQQKQIGVHFTLPMFTFTTKEERELVFKNPHSLLVFRTAER
jgi:hypothetical protein